MLPRGISRCGDGFRASVHVRPFPPRFQRFPADTPIQEMQDWRTRTRKADEERRPAVHGEPHASCGTLAADVIRYLADKQPELTPASYQSLRSELAAWTALYGPRRRWGITIADVRKARAIWKAARYADKTIDHRVRALAGLWHHLDGRKAATPCDDMEKLVAENQRGQPRTIPPEQIAIVARKLKDAHEDLTLARLLILASTGRRPSELKRAIPIDIDERAAVWFVRTGKGGDPTPLPLTADGLAAFQYFRRVGGFAANATFDVSDHAKILYWAGWPMDWNTSTIRRTNRLRPYQARHSVALALAEAGADWTDIRDAMGHKHTATTERFYTGFVATRLRKTTDVLAAVRPLGVANILHTRPGPKPRRPRMVTFKTGS
jgi:integrase